MIWKIRNQSLNLDTRGLVIGIVNVTPDSFSDGGCFFSPDAAVAHGERLITEGADMLDIGGESTRPGAKPVDSSEELQRVLPVVKALANRIPVSIDTRRPAVAEAALAAGAVVVNDVSGLRDPAMVRLVAESGAGAVVMHMQGEPATMQDAPVYDDVAATVRSFFLAASDRCTAAGVAPEQLVYDPGIGFGKLVGHNLTLLAKVGELMPTRPAYVGVSRKSFLSAALGDAELQSREWPTVALTSLLRGFGARLFRVHNVRPNVEALRMTEAILGALPISADSSHGEEVAA